MVTGAPVGLLCRLGLHRRRRVQMNIAGRTVVNELHCQSCTARWLLVIKQAVGGDWNEFAERIN